MDTICFFYRKRDLKEALVEPVGLKSHMLIRVGLNMREGEWFGIRPDMFAGRKAFGYTGNEAEKELSEKTGSDAKQEANLEKTQSSDKTKGFLRRILRFPKRSSACRKEAGEQERFQAERAEKIRRVEDDMRALAAEILELAGEESRCYAVYDDSVRKAVLKESEGGFCLPSLWRRYMDFEEFSGYTEVFWTGLLMPQAVLSHFVILGTASCVPGWIEKCASRMKSLKWILPEDQCGPEILEFVEDFYTEYGLAISLQTLSGGGGLKGLRVLCNLPSNILDFTEDACLNIPETARGSVWLDFLSVEEKRRRIEGRCPGVSYFSLKEKWRRAQRRCKEPLLP